MLEESAVFEVEPINTTEEIMLSAENITKDLPRNSGAG